MYHFLQTLTPEQWAIIGGLLSPVIHYFATKWIGFENKHKTEINWIISFVIPALVALADYLFKSASFTQAVPLYATVYATAQTFYFTTVRQWKNVASLRAALKTVYAQSQSDAAQAGVATPVSTI